MFLEERGKTRLKYYPQFLNFAKIFCANGDKTVTLLRLQKAWELLLIWLARVFGDTKRIQISIAVPAPFSILQKHKKQSFWTQKGNSSTKTPKPKSSPAFRELAATDFTAQAYNAVFWFFGRMCPNVIINPIY